MSLTFHFARRVGALHCTAALVFALCCSASLADPLKVKALTHRANGELLRFPWVSGSNARTAQRINHWIFLTHFDDARVPAKREDGLKKTPYGIATLDFAVTRNDASVLALVIQGEFCGAYCETFEFGATFDADTGRPLRAQDLFTPDGLSQLGQDMQRRNSSAIRDMLTTLRERSPQEENGDGRAEAINMFDECLTRIESNTPAEWMFDNMSLAPDEVTFSQERCSNHAMRGLDELGTFTTRYPIRQLRDGLTPYGRRMIIGEGRASAPTTGFAKVMDGSIGDKLPIVLLLASPRENGSVDGSYFYTRHRQSIRLNGTWNDHILSLEERSDDGKRVQWTLHRDGSGWRGEWKQGSRTLPVRLAAP